MYVWACVTSSDTNTMERRCGQYSVGVMFPIFEDRCVDLRRSMIDASTFEDQCVDLRRSMIGVDLRRSVIDVSTFEDQWSMCRPSNIDGRCEIRLLYLLKTLIL